MKRILLAATCFAVFSAGAASASCYGTGASRYCDGRGGAGATYSPRGTTGSTTYYHKGSPSRTQTYNSTPNLGGGYTQRTYTNYYGR